MPSLSRQGDITNPGPGHIVWPPTSFDQCASTVYCNGVPASNKGSVFAVHCLGPSCHAPVQDTGSSTVFIEGQPAARIGDLTDCKHTVATGSPNVFCGG